MADAALECSEQINFEPSPEVKPAPPVNQMDDAAALLLMLSGGAEDDQAQSQSGAPPALKLPQSQLDARSHAFPPAFMPQMVNPHNPHPPTPGSASKRAMVKVDRVLKDHVAAVSCGIFAGQSVLDLDYLEDSAAETDSNFVMTGTGGIVEIQGTAEGVPFSQEQFLELMLLARNGITDLVQMQKDTIA